MLPCSICGTRFAYHAPCDVSHPGVCHPCAELNLRAGFDSREHLAPEAPLVLSPRDVAALVRYRRHVQRAQGTGPLEGLVTGEGA